MIGWNESSLTSDERLDEFLSHELVHQWVSLEGSYEETVWVTEGAADYYGIVLPFRAGLIDEDTFLRRVNARARTYFASPFRAHSLADVAGRYWSDFRAQQLPYGRGMFYLADLDCRLRAVTPGARGVDDLVLKVLKRQWAGPTVTSSDWVDLVAREVGPQGRQQFSAMVDGQDPDPAEGAFGSRFQMGRVKATIVDLGFNAQSLVTRRVTGLRPRSAAADAGIREGDEITEIPMYDEIVALPRGASLGLAVRRDNRQVRFDLPAGSEEREIPVWLKSS